MKSIDSFRVSLIVLAMALASCGGGGGDDDEDNEPIVNDADLTGLWSGTETRDGGVGVPVTIIVSEGSSTIPDGAFLLVSPELYITGVGETLENSFFADGDGWPRGSRVTFSDGSAKAVFTLNGTAFSKSSINGSYAGGGESGTLSLTYSAQLTNRGASLATVAGSYVTDGGGALSITNGEITYNNANAGPNCIGNGEIAFAQSSMNVYSWLILFSGCDQFFNGGASGFAYLSDAANGGSNNRLLFFGVTQGAPPTQRPLTIAATK